MDSAAEILVIVLAVFLALFLVVGIILGIYLIRLSAEIRKVAEAAQKTVGNIEHAVSGVAKLVSPAFVAGLFAKAINKFTGGSSRKGKK